MFFFIPFRIFLAKFIKETLLLFFFHFSIVFVLSDYFLILLIINTSIVQDMCERRWPGMDYSLTSPPWICLQLPMGDMLLSVMYMSLLAVDMDMLQRRICLSQLWICCYQNFTWWIHFSRLVDMPIPTWTAAPWAGYPTLGLISSFKRGNFMSGSFWCLKICSQRPKNHAWSGMYSIFVVREL